jgi:Icc protein
VLTIAQITDLHIMHANGSVDAKRNAERLRTVLAAIHALRPRPAAIIASGDLANVGTPDEYAALAEILSEAEIPLHLAVGNHDRRGPFLEAFSGLYARVDANGFAQYVVDVGEVRLVVCDTLDESEPQGAFCEVRAAWLADTLDVAPDRPTVVVIHHPPIPSGIQWMDPNPLSDWIVRLEGVLSSRPQVKVVLCGHMHRAYHGVFAGRPVSVASATALQLTLDLTPVDRRVADGRQILVGEPPGFSLVAWTGGTLITHHCVAGHFPDQITYDTPFDT